MDQGLGSTCPLVQVCMLIECAMVFVRHKLSCILRIERVSSHMELGDVAK